MASRYTVTSVDRAIDILHLLAKNSKGLRLSELTRKTDIPKSTLFRILTTLRDRQCVVLDEERGAYQLGVALWELGGAFLRQSSLYSAAESHMRALAEACGESVFLGVLDEGEVIYVRRMESSKSAVVVRKLGQRAPAYCTATGEAMLAFLPPQERERLLGKQTLKAFNDRTTTERDALRRRLEQIRAERVAVVDGEYNSQLLCISSPIFDETGRPAAALTAALLSAQASSERIETIRELVQQAAQKLSRERGYLEEAHRGDGVPEADLPRVREMGCG